MVALVFGTFGTYLLYSSHASTSTSSIEAENGVGSSAVTQVTDGTASGGSAVKFGSGTPTSTVLLGHWDSSALRLGEVGGTASNYNSNKGVDKAMAAILGIPEPVSQIMKVYDGSWDTSYASSGVAKSAEFGHAFAITMPAPGGGGNAGYTAMLNGSEDSVIDGFFNSIPTTETAYVILQNEADNVASLGTDSNLYDQALGYLINRAAPIYAARHLKGGVGPVFTGYNFAHDPGGMVAYFQTWDFIQYVNTSAKPYTVYSIDNYSKYTSSDASTYESIPDLANSVFSLARAEGVTRFGIGEFANSLEWRNHSGQIVGTPATQEAWINAEIPKIQAIQGLEFAVYFHKPTGAESKNAQLLDTGGAFPFTAYSQFVAGLK